MGDSLLIEQSRWILMLSWCVIYQIQQNCRKNRVEKCIDTYIFIYMFVCIFPNLLLYQKCKLPLGKRNRGGGKGMSDVFQNEGF